LVGGVYNFIYSAKKELQCQKMKSSVKKEIRGKRQNKIHFDLGLDF
jgi:hypothetical protein